MFLNGVVKARVIPAEELEQPKEQIRISGRWGWGGVGGVSWQTTPLIPVLGRQISVRPAWYI